MRKLITKFPKLGEEIFTTKVEVANIDGNDELESIVTFLNDLEFEVNQESDSRITAVHTTADAATAEQTVRTLGKNAFSDFNLPPTQIGKEKHTDLC